MTMHNNKKLITHNGSFHSDDVFACATLILMLEKEGIGYEIIRTRDEKIIKTGDYVFDVGGIYDENKNLFDHHQNDFKEKRENNLPYSSFGLIWKKYGEKICGDNKIAIFVDTKLVSPIDAADNGINLFEKTQEVPPYLLQDFIAGMMLTWREQEEGFNQDEMFFKSIEIAKQILSREMIQASDSLSAEKIIISTYQNTTDKRIIVFDRHYPFEYILPNFPEPLFAIYHRTADDSWGIGAIPKVRDSFENKKNFPISWGGLRDKELQKITGVSDAIFCHRGLFLTVAKSREGAIKLAQIALES